ncbi:6-O-methylguanine DNA methyltransferase, DNA binding domain protein [Selenomonas sp. oral taxon 892 str. F0426]|uniref:methylated-DNA--[protein]-cysteine S-methyltransferase n=1 Tax=Selenomonas sp. oral taxon 892 TaxID=1321785 RepID=UPI0003AD1D78|nr:methylated-DNA--[protein]-cysteine S-methyltransferase [Selenomonas sp. oral taxon 892]ERJ89767.1 6-O-methylguanine DNA methyltransferase, DNA binding domain protein [Selenomonas sp. oral taxon 892 str. F0426]
MIYTAHYNSPLGGITLTSDGMALTGLYFDGERDFPDLSPGRKKDLPLFGDVMRWLDLYFDGKEPDFSPALNPTGTAFQMSVWAILRTIPYGETTNYGAIAKRLEKKTGKRMSAQAVGGAVGRNPISIIVPCHRVIGANGSLTGYAGGLDKKEYLLELEGAID